MEEFKLCYENYEISNFGNCRRKLKNGSYKNINGCINNRGYRYFQVRRDNKRLNFLFHQLVAKCFIGDRPIDGTDIDHIDRNKLNNNASNLRYVSRSENLQNTHRYRDDIKETDPRKRNNALCRSHYESKYGYTYRKRGTGQIQKRIERNYFEATIYIDKKRHYKSFDTFQEAEEWLKTFNPHLW